ncbi:MAG: DNA sulfur modification protein DndE [Nitrospirae bacterium]|nr:DNA sulfur modification protein DndE [Nitrospirota bacterium]
MKPPVEHVRVSARGREILIRIKRNTGLEHWNEISRIALCRSLANPTPPPKLEKVGDSSIDMEWKTFAGQFQEEIAALVLLRAKKDGINLTNKDAITDYFRAHLERGINALHGVKTLSDIFVEVKTSAS